MSDEKTPAAPAPEGQPASCGICGDTGVYESDKGIMACDCPAAETPHTTHNPGEPVTYITPEQQADFDRKVEETPFVYPPETVKEGDEPTEEEVKKTDAFFEE